MIRKLLTTIGIVALSFSFIAPATNMLIAEASVSQTEDSVDPCSTYVWIYKEENGKRYMRLWDRMYGVYVTDWILVD